MKKNLASEHPSVRKFARHVNPSFIKLLGVLGYGRLFVRARDVWLWDHEERKYLDFLAGFGAVNLGHNHPRLAERLKRFLSEEAPNLVHVGPSTEAAELAETLAGLLSDPLDITLFSGSGAEGVEAGLKLARAATGREGFLYCEGGYHGTNLGTLSVMGQDRMRGPFEPLLPGCHRVPFGDLDALEKSLSSRKFAGFLAEPIQGEGGVVLPPAGYLRDAQELCRRHGTVLVLDEVQTGLGRTGTLFSHEAEGFVPDVLVLSKALSGSMTPIAATVTSQRIYGKAYGSMERFDLHGSTFAGNAFACVAALETLRILTDEKLASNSAARGKQLLDGLREKLSGHPLVREVRGRGLLVGVELGPTDPGWIQQSLARRVARAVFGQWVALKLLEEQIVCQPASIRWDVLKLEPPLTIQAREVDRMVEAVAKVLGEYRGVAALIKDVTARVGRQFLSRWRF